MIENHSTSSSTSACIHTGAYTTERGGRHGEAGRGGNEKNSKGERRGRGGGGKKEKERRKKRKHVYKMTCKSIFKIYVFTVKKIDNFMHF